MSSILEIFFPLCDSDTVRWQRRTPDVEHGIWPDVADERLQQWLQTDAIRLYIPGEWISVWQVELPDVARKQIPTILPALLEEELNQDIDELHFAPLKIDQQLATVAVIHQQHMRNIAQWLQANGITRATVAPDWMSIPCGYMAGDAQRVICRIDECRGWSAGRALAPVMFRAQLNEQDLPFSLTVVGIAPEELSAWAGADAERLTVTALPAITTYTEYPTPFEDVNLNAINDLKKHFPKNNIGFSDHSSGFYAAIAAVPYGITFIEKHFTLDKSMSGPDHLASIEPDELKHLCIGVRCVEKSLGSNSKVVTASERKNKIVARKSIIAKTEIKKGEVFSEKNITTKRPGNGISPMEWYNLLGKIAEQDFIPDELIIHSEFKNQGE